MKNIIAFSIAALGLTVAPAMAKEYTDECVNVVANYNGAPAVKCYTYDSNTKGIEAAKPVEVTVAPPPPPPPDEEEEEEDEEDNEGDGDGGLIGAW